MASALLVFVSVCLTLSNGDQATFDCPMRELALEFAMSINPTLSTAQLQEISDALNGAQEAQNCSVTPKSLPNNNNKNNPIYSDPTLSHINFNIATELLNDENIPAIYVDINHGIDDITSDKSNGFSIDKPFRTIQYAIEFSRQMFGDSNKWKKILLRKGIYYIDSTIILNNNDNKLLISSYNNEYVKLTGANNINCTWTLYKSNINDNKDSIYQCNLNPNKYNLTKHGNNPIVPGIRINGERGIRARYPNANPETDGFGSSLSPKSYLPSLLPTRPNYNVNLRQPLRNDSSYNYFQTYLLGIEGNCQNFVPPAGYWCSSDVQGGGAATYKVSSGLVYDTKKLPHSPYADLDGAIVQAWRQAHWASWMFSVNSETSNDSVLFFEYGGYQGGRGGTGDEFFIENVFEELDYATEFIYNETSSTLYFVANGSSNSQFNNINDIVFEVPQTKILMQLEHTSNVIINGMNIGDSAYTYMDDHGLPSGGDWALQYSGAITLYNTSNITISHNNFTRLDGNCIFLYSYNKDITINNNEFKWIGDSAIALWGQTQGIDFEDYKLFGETMTMGVYDKESSNVNANAMGTQPHRVNVIQNYVHELGIFEKQSSFYFQAKSHENIIAYNIFYNGPRAGINFNDGFGGNSKIYKNLLFNTCRESSDHGPFNSWDRQVFSVDNNVIKGYDEIYENFILSNYGALYGVDNDDGSAFYQTHDNFMIYGENGLKSNFGGHNNHHYNNIYAYMSETCWKEHFTLPQPASSYLNKYVNNTCVLNVTIDTNKYNATNLFQFASLSSCTDVNWNTSDSSLKSTIIGVETSNNEYWMPQATANNIGICSQSINNLQQNYQMDKNSIVHDTWPSDDDLLQMARNMLF